MDTENRRKQEFLDSLKVVQDPNEKYIIKRDKVRMEQARRREHLSKLKRRIAVILFAGGVAFGSIAGYNAYKEAKDKNITQEEETIESLGLNQELMDRMEDINERLNNDNISDTELMKLAEEVNNLQFDVTKAKLAHTLNVQADDIKLYSIPVENGVVERVQVTGKEMYSKATTNQISYGTPKAPHNTISHDIANQIHDIAEMKRTVGDLKWGKWDRKELIERCQTSMNETEKFALIQMKVDKDNNISMDYSQKLILESEQQNQEAQNKDSEYER